MGSSGDPYRDFALDCRAYVAGEITIREFARRTRRFRARVGPPTSPPTRRQPMSEQIKTAVVARADATGPVAVVPMHPVVVILVRAGRTWLQAFLAFAGILVIGSFVVDPADWAKWLDWGYLADVGRRGLVCALVATAVAAVSALQNALELLARVDERSPTLRA